MDWKLESGVFSLGKRHLGTQACNSNHPDWDYYYYCSSQVFGLAHLFGSLFLLLVVYFGFVDWWLILESSYWGAILGNPSFWLITLVERYFYLFFGVHSPLFVHIPLRLEFVNWRLDWSFLLIEERGLKTQGFESPLCWGLSSIFYWLSQGVTAKNLSLHIVFFSRKSTGKASLFLCGGFFV